MFWEHKVDLLDHPIRGLVSKTLAHDPTPNENVKTKEKWKNVSDKNVSLIKWVIFGVHIEK